MRDQELEQIRNFLELRLPISCFNIYSFPESFTHLEVNVEVAGGTSAEKVEGCEMIWARACDMNIRPKRLASYCHLPPPMANMLIDAEIKT
ncbi:hypothetical protein OPQ81_008790 [Rhizoctonia solani]|nr:hypothetical protein OPQ81_008790 [Rhizoctonia solani]